MATRSNTWVCDRSLAGIAGSDSVGGNEVFPISTVFVRRTAVRQTDNSFRGDLPSVVCLYDREASIMRRL
jgi:hypothetical protein